MELTIGEIINQVLPFSNSCECNIIYGKPFLRILVGGVGLCTRVYMYVIQTGEHKYAVCDSWTDIHGHKYLPTGNVSTPFISEKNKIGRWFGTTEDDDSEFITNLNLEGFMKYFYKVLYEYDIIKFSPENLDLKMVDMGFTSNKIKNTLTQTFRKKRRSKGTIYDLLRIVMEDNKEFDLPTLLPRELKCVRGKLRDIGLDATLEGESENQKIVKISFVRNVCTIPVTEKSCL